jgi:hypothetical protein
MHFPAPRSNRRGKPRAVFSVAAVAGVSGVSTLAVGTALVDASTLATGFASSAGCGSVDTDEEQPPAAIAASKTAANIVVQVLGERVAVLPMRVSCFIT